MNLADPAILQRTVAALDSLFARAGSRALSPPVTKGARAGDILRRRGQPHQLIGRVRLRRSHARRIAYTRRALRTNMRGKRLFSPTGS